MSETLVELSVDAGVARVHLNRPNKRNALTREFLSEIAAAVSEAERDDSVRLLVLSASGPVFCAGMDLGQMQQRASQDDAVEQWQLDTQVYRDLLVALFRFPMPTVAVVQGPALAGGLGLILACDIVLAAEAATFALPEPKRGISAAVVAPFLIHRIGAGRANSLLLSGRDISCEEALRIGLCHQAVPAETLSEREDELLSSILSGAPAALSATKKLVIDCVATNLFDQLDAGMRVSAQARETADAREGLDAFLQKRKPRWIPDGH